MQMERRWFCIASSVGGRKGENEFPDWLKGSIGWIQITTDNDTRRWIQWCSHLIFHINEWTHVKFLWEGHAVIKFDAMHSGVVKIKPFQL